MLYSKVVEVNERVIPHMPELGEDTAGGPDDMGRLVEGVSGKMLRELEPVGELTGQTRSRDDAS